LSSGYGELIARIHKQIPQVTPDSKRLQMVVCSATLHSMDVRKMAVSVSYCPIIYSNNFIKYFSVILLVFFGFLSGLFAHILTLSLQCGC